VRQEGEFTYLTLTTPHYQFTAVTGHNDPRVHQTLRHLPPNDTPDSTENSWPRGNNNVGAREVPVFPQAQNRPDTPFTRNIPEPINRPDAPVFGLHVNIQDDAAPPSTTTVSEEPLPVEIEDILARPPLESPIIYQLPELGSGPPLYTIDEEEILQGGRRDL
jgi:hypothetical protein